jgi:hypothetical protein
MKTVQNQLLLKLSHFLSGQIGRWEVVAWAKDALGSLKPEGRVQNPIAGQAMQPGADLVLEVLAALSMLPEERTPHYSLARADLSDYRRRLEEAAMRHTLQ